MSQITRSEAYFLAMQLHCNYYVGLKELGQLKPEQELDYQVALQRQRIGLVIPFTLEEQIAFIESKGK